MANIEQIVVRTKLGDVSNNLLFSPVYLGLAGREFYLGHVWGPPYVGSNAVRTTTLGMHSPEAWDPGEPGDWFPVDQFWWFNDPRRFPLTEDDMHEFPVYIRKAHNALSTALNDRLIIDSVEVLINQYPDGVTPDVRTISYERSFRGGLKLGYDSGLVVYLKRTRNFEGTEVELRQTLSEAP